MPQFIAPGVYVLERDFSDYIAALSTTVVGMVGTAKQGPINEATFNATPEQWLTRYGEPNVDQYGPHAALNYLRRGNSLWYVRIAKEYSENAATIASDLSFDVNGDILTLEVDDASGLSEGDYIRIRQTGKPTSPNCLITDITGTTITLQSSLLFEYNSSGTSDSVIDVAEVSDAANQAEVFAYGRALTNVNRVVKFSARYPGEYANFGTRQGIEVKIEDGGQFANVDPVTGSPITSLSGIPLQGVQPSKPSVDSIYELLALTATDDGVLVGETRGVNYDSVVARVTEVADDGSSEIELTVVDDAGFTDGDTVTISGTGTGADGLSGVITVSSNVITVAVTSGGAIAATGLTGYVTNDTASSLFGVVYRCTSITDPSNPTWEPVGVLTKRVRVLYQGRQVEVFDNVIGYDPSSANYWDTVIGTTTRPVSQYVFAEYVGTEGEQPINTYHITNHPNNPRLVMGLDTVIKIADLTAAATLTFRNAVGYNGDNPDASDYIGIVDAAAGIYTGLQNFRRVDRFDINILCVPGVSLPAVVQEMTEILEARADCLGIVDPPFGLSPTQVIDWHNGTGAYTGLHDAFVTNKAALYYPWVKQYDPYTKRELWLPPSTILPGVVAYNDQVGETWYAPAGILRGGVPNAIAVEYLLDRGEIELMYGPGNGNAINPIVKFATDGITVYGNRTLQRHPSALDRVNVRRLLFFIEKSVASASRKLVFEQNDPILWGQFINLVDPFLASLKGRRALEWYRVVCDETTNTPERRNNNELYAKVYIIPVKAAEKIVIDFTLLASGANVDEFIVLDQDGNFVDPNQ